MRNWWYSSSRKQKFWIAAILLVGVNCYTIFGLNLVIRGLFVGNIVLFGLAMFYPSEYED